MQNSKIKLVVVNEEALGYIFPERPFMVHVLGCTESVLARDGSSMNARGNKTRLANAQDFDQYNVSFDGYRNNPEYLYDTTVVYPFKIKATILLENTFGIIVARHVWLKKTYFEKVNGSFYNQKLVAIYTPKGKKKKVGFRFEKAVIAKGWQNVPGAMVKTIPADFIAFDESHSVKYEDCKKSLSDIILDSEKDAPKPFIINQNK